MCIRDRTYTYHLPRSNLHSARILTSSSRAFFNPKMCIRDRSIALGLDLKGGVYVEYEATMSDEMREECYDFGTLLDSTMSIIANRLTEKGYPEATVSQLGDVYKRQMYRSAPVRLVL